MGKVPRLFIGSDDCYPMGTDRPKTKRNAQHMRASSTDALSMSMSPSSPLSRYSFILSLLLSHSFPLTLSCSISHSVLYSLTPALSPSLFLFPLPYTGSPPPARIRTPFRTQQRDSRIFSATGPVVWTPSQLRAQSHGYGVRGWFVKRLLSLS